MINRIPIPDAPGRQGIEFDRAVRERLENSPIIKLQTCSVQELESLTPANHDGILVRCSNGDAGSECLAFCDGKAWYAISLDSKVSIT